jgi:hypothetical protein
LSSSTFGNPAGPTLIPEDASLVFDEGSKLCCDGCLPGFGLRGADSVVTDNIRGRSEAPQIDDRQGNYSVRLVWNEGIKVTR